MRDGFVAHHNVGLEPLTLPQISKAMVKSVVHEQMSVAGDCANLFRTGNNLGPNDAETRLDSKLAQHTQQLFCHSPCWSVVKREQAMMRGQFALRAGNQDKTGHHVLVFQG
jgi:hypothetical protein